MARFLVYAAPSRGDLYPLVPALDKLIEHGHSVFARMPASEVRDMQNRGIAARPLSESVECAIRTDWQQFSIEGSIRSLLDHMVLRGEFEATDLRTAIAKHKPDGLLIDANCFGAAAVAESSGISWASWGSCLLPFPRPGIPPFGLGLPYKRGTIGALKNWAKTGSVQKTFDQALAQLNELRTFLGAACLETVLEWPSRLANLIYFTAEPLEYHREWPANVHLVGPSTWEPYEQAVTLDSDNRPIILVSSSIEYQDDSKLIAACMQSLSPIDYQIVITTAANNYPDSGLPKGVHITRFTAHNPILEKAACVICPGNLGLVQKALCKGVPILAIPQCRDQIEIGQRLKHLNAGQALPLRELTNTGLPAAVEKTIECRPGAQAVQQAFAQYDSTTSALAILEQLIDAPEPEEDSADKVPS